MRGTSHDALVSIAAAAVLDGSDQQGVSLAQLTGVLEPIAHVTGRTIFALGSFGAAFSSVIDNATPAAGSSPTASDGPTGCRTAGSALASRVCWPSVHWSPWRQAAPPGPAHHRRPDAYRRRAPLLAPSRWVLTNNRRLTGHRSSTRWQNAIAAVGPTAICGTCDRLVTSLLWRSPTPPISRGER